MMGCLLKSEMLEMFKKKFKIIDKFVIKDINKLHSCRQTCS